MKTGEPVIVNGDDLRIVLIIVEKVLGILRQMKVDTSPWSDQAYPRTLWESREEITGALPERCESSLDTGEGPEDWRVSIVVHLFNQ